MVCTVLQLKSFVARHTDTCCCTPGVPFLELDVAIVRLITVRKVQIRHRKSVCDYGLQNGWILENLVAPVALEPQIDSQYLI